MVAAEGVELRVNMTSVYIGNQSGEIARARLEHQYKIVQSSKDPKSWLLVPPLFDSVDRSQQYPTASAEILRLDTKSANPTFVALNGPLNKKVVSVAGNGSIAFFVTSDGQLWYSKD